MSDTATEILETLSFLDDWEERYRYIIDLGKNLPQMAEADKHDLTKVQGCQSQVWIKPPENADRTTPLMFEADSDALIVKGLVAVLLALYNGKTAAEINGTDPMADLSALGLQQHLSGNRANGLVAMNQRIRAYAQQILAEN